MRHKITKTANGVTDEVTINLSNDSAHAELCWIVEGDLSGRSDPAMIEAAKQAAWVDQQYCATDGTLYRVEVDARWAR